MASLTLCLSRAELSHPPALPFSVQEFRLVLNSLCFELQRSITSGGTRLSNQAWRTLNGLTYSPAGQANQLFLFEGNTDETDGYITLV